VIDLARQSGLKLKVCDLTAIRTVEFPRPAQRPLNSRLDCSKLRGAFGLHLPRWQTGVQRMLTETQGA
jgi:dTDP-4-dehydrorhamnose reductase